ncbi:hypothetical protein CEXT_804221 [Caerostris extrusa]|uniref:Secreted protein n=1 Tax=Caerostris extrusa TaxID=172846 RepID=A0AAV4N243_CAEEX|nr:hypothetical protein CEXT_804221 [Caerostris extrusa]
MHHLTINQVLCFSSLPLSFGVVEHNPLSPPFALPWRVRTRLLGYPIGRAATVAMRPEGSLPSWDGACVNLSLKLLTLR